MELIEHFSDVKPEFLLILITSFFALISWIIKGLIEKPLTESRITFRDVSEKRIEILSEIKSRLAFIAYFPSEEESKEFKEQLQEILLRDGKVGFLNKLTFEAVLKLSIDPVTNEKLLLKTIEEIDEDLYIQVSKVQDEVKFYINFSNYHPVKRFFGFLILAIQYLIALTLVLITLTLIVSGLIYLNWFLKIGLILLLLGGSFGVGRAITR